MIITRTPYRVSFFGGGTDLPAWYRQHGGAALTSTIAHYCYLSVRPTPPHLPAKYRVAWSRLEDVDRLEDIQHPGVRACLKYMGTGQGVEVSHLGDLPARSGLGSSSAFTVGMLKALYALQGYRVVPNQAIAGAAVHVEQEVLRETVGIQDQIECAIGGLNVIRIAPSGDWEVERVAVTPETLAALQGSLMLFYTGFQRSASEIQADTVAALHDKTETMQAILGLVYLSTDILIKGNLDEFGGLLHEGWMLKQRLSTKICTEQILDLYEAARHAGALGGKLLGAGGGGFLLLYARPPDQPAVRAALPGLLEVPFRFESEGSRLILV